MNLWNYVLKYMFIQMQQVILGLASSRVANGVQSPGHRVGLFSARLEISRFWNFPPY